MEYDYIIIGSGFGGSVSALRLSQKGYKVLVIEQGKWFNKPEDFPKTNWNLRKWLWMPALGLRGIFKLSFFRHVTVLSGTGVGGGSLVYANTLPIPKDEYFNTGSWAKLADWKSELAPFYALGKKMLGATPHPYMSRSDKAMQQLATEIGRPEAFEKTDVAVYFGKPEVTVTDPYFDGQGPDRTGCCLCGGCMVGCRFNAKNTLDKNYLHLAQKAGAKILAESRVFDVKPIGQQGENGYEVFFKPTFSTFGKTQKIRAKGVIFAGGVMGTVRLLLNLKRTSLPNLSDNLGHDIRTNSESLIGVTTFQKVDMTEGIAIGSIIQLDESRHVEPVKYSAGSGFWRLFFAPMVSGNSMVSRGLKAIGKLFTEPLSHLKAFAIDDWSKRTLIMLYMESIDSTLRFSKGLLGNMTSRLSSGPPPEGNNPKAQELARKMEKIIDGKAMVMNIETILGIPTTAHILGGAVMGKDAAEGVIDQNNKVFGYENMMICDGSIISANIGVNPSLSITAITERAMSLIPDKK
ncbi:MAG: GMC family oxidoreductase [Spirosomataceae bacterium]